MATIIRPILSWIKSLSEHQTHVEQHPEDYCPDNCPYCGKSDLRLYGCYYRVPDRESPSGESFNPVKILRFICQDEACGRTCSCLPACIPPHRWYQWESQEKVFSQLLSGDSIHQVSKSLTPARRTVARWWRWLNDQYPLFSHHILNRFHEDLGRYNSASSSFWSALFEQKSLMEGMVINIQSGVAIP
ncbi:MAG: hypothetical protein HOE82_15590 [Gammaproteobacteria bacterium]|jgi:hypothetical protein|nr:hypothetical protein [Gammaproteobacteria bacterium]MBT5635522.1 hypothetical protein [Gammaproteobacteria bacterium]